VDLRGGGSTLDGRMELPRPPDVPNTVPGGPGRCRSYLDAPTAPRDESRSISKGPGERGGAGWKGCGGAKPLASLSDLEALVRRHSCSQIWTTTTTGMPERNHHKFLVENLVVNVIPNSGEVQATQLGIARRARFCANPGWVASKAIGS
jgi:hypothetical protein